LWKRPSSYRGRPRFRAIGPTKIAALRADRHENLDDAFDGRHAVVPFDDKMRRLAADVTWALIRTPPDPHLGKLKKVYLVTDGPVPQKRRPELVRVGSLGQLKARAEKEGIKLYYEAVRVAGARLRSGQPAVVVKHDWGVVRPKPVVGPRPPCFGLAHYLAVRGIEGGIVLYDPGTGSADACPE
jgi:hypothetical protein